MFIRRFSPFDEMFGIFRDFDSLFSRTLEELRAFPDLRGERLLPTGSTTTALAPASAATSPAPAWSWPMSWYGSVFPAVECFTRDDQLVFRAELPGVHPDDVEVNLAGNQLTIRGQKREARESDQGKVLYREISHGQFERSFTLPEGVKADQVKAAYHDGVLEITLPAEELQTGRRVPIEVTREASTKAKAA